MKQRIIKGLTAVAPREQRGSAWSDLGSWGRGKLRVLQTCSLSSKVFIHH